MVRVLQINEEAIKEIEKVKNYAIAHPYDENFRKLVLSGDVRPVGDNPEHVVHIHDGYRAVYSIDILDSKKYHHLSVSVESKTDYPSVPSVTHIMEFFGMGNDLYAMENIWPEEDVLAINLIKEFVE